MLVSCHLIYLCLLLIGPRRIHYLHLSLVNCVSHFNVFSFLPTKPFLPPTSVPLQINVSGLCIPSLSLKQLLEAVQLVPELSSLEQPYHVWCRLDRLPFALTQTD